MTTITLDINAVFRANPDADTVIEGFVRLVEVDQDYMAHVMRLDLYPRKPLMAPIKVPVSFLISEIDKGNILANQEFDCNLPATTDHLSKPARDRYDTELSILSYLLDECGDLFDAKKRGAAFTKCAKAKCVHRRTVRRIFYQYLWGGQTELALVPRFECCGGPGQEQKLEVKKRGRSRTVPSKKRGRKPKSTQNVQELPLAADRAELLSNKAGGVPKIGIIPEIMPPMRPDRKGKVEAAIKAVKHNGLSIVVPGSYPKNKGRRQPDGTKTAALTKEELEIIIVNILIGLNNDPVPLDHIPPEMLKDTEEVTHIGLYKWGLEHRPGSTRKLEPKDVCTYLMTSATASLTPQGIHYDTQTYKSPRLLSAGYCYNPDGGNRIDIRYDEHASDYVLFFDKFQHEWVEAINANEEILRLKAAFWELEAHRLELNRLREKAKMENLHKEDEKDKQNAKKFRAVTQEAKEARSGRPVSHSKDRMRSNKALEVLAGDILDSSEASKSLLAAISKAERVRSKRVSPTAKDTHEVEVGRSLAERSKKLWEEDDETLDK